MKAKLQMKRFFTFYALTLLCVATVVGVFWLLGADMQTLRIAAGATFAVWGFLGLVSLASFFFDEL